MSSAPPEAKPIPRSRPARVRKPRTGCRKSCGPSSVPTLPMRHSGRGGSAPTGRGGWRPGWSNPTLPPDVPQGKINVTDPDSRTMKKVRGYLQGYNAQTVVTEDQVIVAAEISVATQDFGHLRPVVGRPRRAGRRGRQRAAGDGAR